MHQAPKRLGMDDLIPIPLEFRTDLARNVGVFPARRVAGQKGLRRKGILFSFKKNIANIFRHYFTCFHNFIQHTLIYAKSLKKTFIFAKKFFIFFLFHVEQLIK
jgi:hypothetical protein